VIQQQQMRISTLESLLIQLGIDGTALRGGKGEEVDGASRGGGWGGEERVSCKGGLRMMPLCCCVLHCVVVRCIVSQCVAVCCSVLQYNANDPPSTNQVFF